MKSTIVIATDASYFDGHFPGQPVLPGVVELLLALEALAPDSNRPVALREIRFLRLRQLVRPGEQLALVARELEDGRRRIEITRAETVVANGELVLGSPNGLAQCGSLIAVAPTTETLPTLDQLLPHRPPMRFVTQILGAAAEGLDCAACIPAGSGLVTTGKAPLLAGVEAAAQAAAAWEALLRWRETKVAAARVGYLVALRDVVFCSGSLLGEKPFTVQVRLHAAAAPLTHYRFAVSQNGSALANGMIATFLTA